MQQTSDVDRHETTWLAAGAFLLLIGLVVRNAWVTEDAYITLRTVDNWTHGFGLRWNIVERVQSYTHPLWMLLLSAGYFVTREAYGTTIALGLATTAGAALLLAKLARTPLHAAVALGLLALSRAFVDYSTSGLENPLTHLLVAAFVWVYTTRLERVRLLSLLAALIALNRSDAALLIAPALVHTLLHGLRSRGLRATVRAALPGFLPYLAWALFSLFYYGFLFPNTAYAKLNTGLPRSELAAQGFAYLVGNIAWDVPTAAILALGVVLGLLSRRLPQLLLVAGVLLYLAYVVRVGGDFMYGRFLTLPLFGAACCIALSELRLERPTHTGLLLLPFPLLFWHPSAQEQYHNPGNGIVDERLFYRDGLGLMMFTRGRALPHQIWVDEGRDLAANRVPVHITHNVGIKGYYAGPDVHIVDLLALTDPLLARLPARYDPYWRVGHYARHLPNGYVETIREGSCKMDDPELCAYYAKLHEVVAGELWSWSRLKTIAMLNFGAYDRLLDSDRYRYPEVARAELKELTTPLAEGSPWNGPGTRVFGGDGLEIALGKLSHARWLKLSLDGNDSYVIEFKRGRRRRGQLESDPTFLPQLRTREWQVPKLAAEKGFDTIVVRPAGGDGAYSAGFVRLLK